MQMGASYVFLKAILAAAICAIPLNGQSQPAMPPLDRLVRDAQQNAGWKTAKTIDKKLSLIREVALKKQVVSDPVSDRYLITALGGPIDLVHFLGLAVSVCSRTAERKPALFEQWKREGGPDFEAGRSETYPPEAHPDDLPSNALGALFGEEIRDHNHEPDFDVVTALKDFLRPFEPLPDAITKKYSHRAIVMGLPERPSYNQIRSRREWFTATPLFALRAIDPARARLIGDAASALRMAGFELRSFEGRLIVIDRITVKR